MSPKLNNNELSNKEGENAIKKYNKTLLNKFLNLMKEIWNQKHIPKQWGLSYTLSCTLEDPHAYTGISIQFIIVKVVMNILLIDSHHSIQVNF